METEIERRNASGYNKAASLLADLKTIVEQNGGTADFIRRLHSIHERHAQKGRFIDRLNAFDYPAQAKLGPRSDPSRTSCP
ncbi:hypothetical protein [Rhizobium leguminosarum]|uniref:hypothetical protein n=1 Tax=Rhizobium leguminosarum TaxID=384 RepID=UPI003ED06885